MHRSKEREEERVNRSESKYYNTAVKMDTAFLEILEKKDFAYITVKEICEKAGVNRSTFYLHYETLGDLLSESMEYTVKQFLEYMKQQTAEESVDLQNCSMDEVVFITPKYLTPYLGYIKEHKRLFHTVLRNSRTLRLDDIYGRLFFYIFSPILERYNIPAEDHRYMMAFYINGFMATITQWIQEDCADSTDHVIKIIQICIPNRTKNE